MGRLGTTGTMETWQADQCICRLTLSLGGQMTKSPGDILDRHDAQGLECLTAG